MQHYLGVDFVATSITVIIAAAVFWPCDNKMTSCRWVGRLTDRQVRTYNIILGPQSDRKLAQANLFELFNLFLLLCFMRKDLAKLFTCIMVILLRVHSFKYKCYTKDMSYMEQYFRIFQDVSNSVLRWCGNGFRGLEGPRMAKVS